jgi:hypothetical protein
MTNDWENHVLFLEEHRLLVCKACKYALSPSPPDSIKNHLQKTHKHTIPLPVRKDLLEYIATLALVDSHPVSIPTHAGVPLFCCLDVIPGYRCNEDRCDLLTTSEPAMKNHC